MPSWKKVIVSGSQTHLSGITSSVLTQNNLLIANAGGAIGNSGVTLSGNTLALGSNSITSTGANSVLTGSFSGTFSGSLSVNLQDLTAGDGIESFTYDGNSAATVQAAVTATNGDFLYWDTTGVGGARFSGSAGIGYDSLNDRISVSKTLALTTPLAVGALSSTMLVITSSNRVATQTLGTGVATFLSTPSSANLAAAVTDETGTGTLVFSASPTFTGTVNAANITATGNLIVTGSTTLGDAADKSLTIRGQSVTLSNPLSSTANVNNILVLTSSNRISTQSIDSRVWGTTLVDNNGTSFTANRVPFATDGNSLIDSDRLTFNNSTNVLTVNTSTFGLDVGVAQGLSVAGNTTLQGNLIVTGSTTLGDASGDSVTVNAATIGIANVGAGTTDTVLIRDGSNTIKTRTIDTRVWGSTLISGSGTANQIAYFNASTGIAGDAGLTYNAGTDTVTVAGDLAVNGGDITTTATTFNLLAGATSGITIGAAATTTTLPGDLAVNGGDITTTSTNFNLLAGATGTLTIGASATNVTIPGNLFVNGSTTVIDTSNLSIQDKFIVLGRLSGSQAPAAEGGIIVEGAGGSGSAFVFNSGSGAGVSNRWGLALSVATGSADVTPTDFMVSAIQASGAPSSAPTYGGSNGGFGNIYVNSSDESIWIFS